MFKKKNSNQIPTNPNGENAQDDSSKDHLRKVRAFAASAGIAALTLAGCAAPEGSNASPSTASSTPTAEAPASATIPEAVQMRSEAQAFAREMASDIVQAYTMADESVKYDEPAAEGASYVQGIHTTVDGAQYTVQLQRYDGEQPAADNNLEAVSITALGPDGNPTYDFGIALYQTGDVMQIQSTDEGVTHSIDFSETGPVTETGDPATLNDQANLLIRAQAMLETAQGK